MPGHEHNCGITPRSYYQTQPSPEYYGVNGHLWNYSAHRAQRPYEFSKVRFLIRISPSLEQMVCVACWLVVVLWGWI